MAYNLIGACSEDFDWDTFHKEILQLRTQSLEIFPIRSYPDTENDTKSYYLGISIPFAYADSEDNFWNTFENALDLCIDRFGIELFDLYNGKRVQTSDVSKIKKAFS